jgi:RNA polymerase sporulation-specific sigma factor
MATPRGFTAKDQAATRRLVQAAQRGERDAEDELVRRYEPLVQHTIWRLKLPPWCEREDLAQEARLGLVTAMREWRPERGAFPAFAQRCVKNKALLAVNSASRHKHQALNLATSLEETVAEDSSDERRSLRLVDVLPTPDDAQRDPESWLLVREQIANVLHALPTLTASERAAMSGGLSGQTNGQLAQALEVTPKAASQAAYRARRKLAAALPRAA